MHMAGLRFQSVDTRKHWKTPGILFLTFATHPSQFICFLTQMTGGGPLQASPNLLLLAIKPKYLHASGTNSVKMSSPSKTSPAINVLHLISIEMRHLNAFLDSSRVQHREVRKWMCLLDPKTSSKLLQSDSSCYCQLLLRLDQWTRLQLEPERQASAPPSHLPLCMGEAMDCCRGNCGQPEEASSTRERRGLANDGLEPLSV